MDGWISVKDRLPEKGVRVLLYTGNDPYIGIGSYHSNDIFCVFEATNNKHERFFYNDVTHWQPLPEPPPCDWRKDYA